MAMSNGNTGGMTSEINVTPMIDVLLVLLIIFMVIVPALPRGESALIPRPAMNDGPSNPDTVVLEVLKGNAGQPAFRINQHAVAKEDLPARLASIFANRAERVLFLKGDDQLNFTEIAEVIDIGHAAGVDHIGLMTPKVLAGQ
ncbi:MAG TPA: biopolymer transporter ExbD [Terracidiphilus sp.]|nr:biopolymer transporter ExbD [Terracidiphilus sp.]